MKVRWFLVALLLVALLVPALMITGARVLGIDGGRVVRLVSFTPYALVLYVVAALLLLLALTVGRGGWRTASGAVAVPVLLLTGVHAFWLGDAYVGGMEAADAGPTLSVMTANLAYGAADAAELVEAVTAADVDVLVLSEVTPQAVGRLRAAGLGRLLPHSVGRAAPLVSGTMVFADVRLARPTPLDTTFRGYTVTARTDGLGDVHLLAVHPHPPLGEALRWVEDHRVVADAAASLPDGEPALVVGDLNATPDHAPLRRLENLGFRTATDLAGSGFQPTWPAMEGVSLLGLAVPSLLQLDHVLANDLVAAVSTETVPISGTDHRAVIATLAVR